MRYALLLLVLTGCDPQKSYFGLDAIRTMKTPPDDPNLGCGLVLPPDAKQDDRLACTFKIGASPESTLGVAPAVVAQLPIRHIIVMMKENRSFDHLLGHLRERGQPFTDAVPADYVNVDLKGEAVSFSEATTTCLKPDPGHQASSMLTAVNGGKMDGFVKNAAQTTDTDGHYVMTMYDEAQLPFNYFLAKTWALNDRHFAPMVGGTFSNRNFFMLGVTGGAVDTGIVFPSPDSPSIFQLLMSAGYTWGAYTDSFPVSGSFDWNASDPGVHPLSELTVALDEGTLPNVVFVDGIDSIDDDHPVADLQKGEAFSKQIYDHLITSPQWNTTALIWTYDEGGGFPDHVDPGSACRATPTSPFVDRGPRIPLVVVSPWAKRNYVSHVVQDHTAITRFIETVFGLPALSARDANSPALLDLFDFTCGRDLSFPRLRQSVLVAAKIHPEGVSMLLASVMVVALGSHGEAGRLEKFQGALLAQNEVTVVKGPKQVELDELLANRPSYTPALIMFSIAGGGIFGGAFIFIVGLFNVMSFLGTVATIAGPILMLLGVGALVVAIVVTTGIGVVEAVRDGRIRKLREELRPSAPVAGLLQSDGMVLARF